MTKVSLEAVRDILLSPDSHKITAQRHGVSRQTIELIRYGKMHIKKFPEIPRRNSFTRHSCKGCAHWFKDQCSLDFPEPNQNMYFASECNIFLAIPNDQSITAP
jgi:hypothetical protein